MEYACYICDDSGYLNIVPKIYCTCSTGDFYEDRDELKLQIQEGELDIGLDIEQDNDLLYLVEYWDQDLHIYFFSYLPFNVA